MTTHALELHPVAPAALTRFEDRISFVYVDRARVVRDDTGVLIYTSTANGSPVRVPLPAAATAAVLLGPGTSITSPALDSLTRAGAAVLSVGVEGVRTYAWAYSGSSKSRWGQAQARLWADPESRADVARRMYLRRFDEPPPGELTLERLRGAEGARMRALYRRLAQTYRVSGFKRRYEAGNFDQSDPVNQAMSTANACLYGVCLAAVTSIGAIPQLGFVHTGTMMSFVHDVADLYKAEVSIPAAFMVARTQDPVAAVRRVMRRQFREERLLARVVGDIQSLLTPGLVDAPDGNRLHDAEGTVAGGVNWHRITGELQPRTVSSTHDELGSLADDAVEPGAGW